MHNQIVHLKYSMHAYLRESRVRAVMALEGQSSLAPTELRALIAIEWFVLSCKLSNLNGSS